MNTKQNERDFKWGGGGTHIQFMDCLADPTSISKYDIRFYGVQDRSSINSFITQDSSTLSVQFSALNKTDYEEQKDVLQGSGMYGLNQFLATPLQFIEPLDSFYMEITLTDDSSDLFQANQDADDWDDKYVINIGIGNYSIDTSASNGNVSIADVTKAIEVWIGRLGVGNMYVGGEYGNYEGDNNITAEVSSVPDIKYEDNPRDSYVFAIGYKKNNGWSIYHNGSDPSTLQGFDSTGDNGDVVVPQEEGSTLGIYLESTAANNRADYINNLHITFRFKDFQFTDIASQYYDDITE